MKRNRIFFIAALLLPGVLAAADKGGKANGGSGERWSVVSKGVLLDDFTGLKWTQRDNLSGIDWQGAKDYCNGLGFAGGGWRLPSIQELTAIYSGGRDGTTKCGSDWTCQVSSLFYLTGPSFWSSTSGSPGEDGSAQARIIYFYDGGQHQASVSDASSTLRALCVRRS